MSWGTYRHPDTGQVFTLERPKGQRTNAVTPEGEILWSEPNVFPAMCRAFAEGFEDVDAPAWLNAGCQREAMQ